MTDDANEGSGSDTFGGMSDAERRVALDIFGRFLMATRDLAVEQWDQILAGKRKYSPWERLVGKSPDLDDRAREAIHEVLPHIVDTFIYCLLADLDASTSVRVSVESEGVTYSSIARLSWGFPAEPAGNNGWLARFSKQRFEQPY